MIDVITEHAGPEPKMFYILKEARYQFFMNLCMYFLSPFCTIKV